MRSGSRLPDELRAFSVDYDIQPQAYASLLMKTGNTHVICAVSLEEQVPPFLEGRAQGWITAEYSILPGATSSRYKRETRGQSGRSMEIQRLIGRSLRMMVDLRELDGCTLRVDCDVLNADGGTRTASITGAALAVKNTINRMAREGRLPRQPRLAPVAAVSVGVVDGAVLLDLDYREDSRADGDGNFVMAGGDWVEIQVTAEGRALSDEHFAEMQRLARKGIAELSTLWTGSS
ncbi:MAG: ribonuclease PH [Desulfofustis sp.]|jgi:ribonuclease PH|nr:ribonuclease PH [Desulfofustis sp.]